MCIVCQTAMSVAVSAMSVVPGIGTTDGVVVPSEPSRGRVSSILPGTESVSVSLDASTRKCLEKSAGKDVTRKILSAKKLSLAQRKLVADCQAAKSNSGAKSPPGSTSSPSRLISGSGAAANALNQCRLRDARVLPGGSRAMTALDYQFPYQAGVDYGYMQVEKESGKVYGNPHLVPGFGLRSGMWPSTGVNKIAFLAVEYLDAPAAGNELEIARSTADQVNQWLKDQSGGRLRLDFRFGERIYRVNRTSESYLLYKSESNSAPAAIQDIVAAADPSFDFSGIDTLWVINPKSVGSVPIPGYQLGSIPEDFNFPGNPNDPNGQSVVVTNEGNLKRWTGNGVYQYRQDNNFWTFFAHEMMHYIGLQDYRYRTVRVQDDGTKSKFDNVSLNQPMSKFEIMSEQDGGSRSLHSFNRLLLGWWDESQIHCQPLAAGRSISLSLDALADTGSNLKSVMIRLDEFRLLVVESRHKVGYDQWIGEVPVGISQGGGMERRFLAEIGTSGLIAYIHDVRSHQHQSPSHLQIPQDGRYQKIGLVTCTTCQSWANKADPNQVWDPKDMRGPQVVVGYDPFIRTGQSISIEDYTVKNVRSYAGGDVVEITRAP